MAVLEPRSNTMQMGVHRDRLADSLKTADQVWLLHSPGLEWDVRASMASLGEHARVLDEVEALADAIVADSRAGDQIVVMSNGAFGGIHDKLLTPLAQRSTS